MTYQQELPWKGTVAGRVRPAGSRSGSGTGSKDDAPPHPNGENATPTKHRSTAAGEWRIDEPTRRVGRRGLAEARATLARVRAASHEGTAA